MPRAKLTPAIVERKSKKPGVYGDGGGLWLRVREGSASWVYRFMIDGRASAHGLGSYPEISLERAREMSEAARKTARGGTSPVEAKRVAVAASKTFRECAAAYIDAKQDSWGNEKHAAQWTSTLETYAYPVLGDMIVAKIKKEHVFRVLDPIWKSKNETASRVRGRIERVLGWAKARGYREGDNPAAWKDNLDEALEKKGRAVHHPALPYRELAAFYGLLEAQDGVASDALRFTILTAARTGEALGAEWPEIDLDAALWKVPGERTKTKREHRVPLSLQAVAILRKLHKLTGGEGPVFPGQKRDKPLSNMAMLKVLERMKRDDLTVHGFRSSFRDWAEEQTAFGGSIAEAALGHIVGDKVEAAYRRGDLFEKRQRLMELWGAYCATPNGGAKVLPIRALG